MPNVPNVPNAPNVPNVPNAPDPGRVSNVPNAARRAASAFPASGTASPELRPFGPGRIHETWAVFRSGAVVQGRQADAVLIPPERPRDPDFLLQRINRHVFPNYSLLVANADAVARAIDSPLQYLRTDDGDLVHRDDAGGVWRLMTFVPGSASLPVPPSPEQAHEAALAYGEFAAGLAPLDPATIVPSIPRFHDTPHRYRGLLAGAVTRGDATAARPTHAARDTKPGTIGALLAWLAERGDRLRFAVDGLESGVLPTRVCHNDAKADNVLIHPVTGRRLSVVDLDTVMPGTLLYDVGDLLRSAAATVGEDEADESLVGVRWECAEAIVDGFAAGAGPVLTHAERTGLRASGWLLAVEQGIRYLTDHVQGSRYYRTEYDGQNFDRARNQFALAVAFEAAGWAPPR